MTQNTPRSDAPIKVSSAADILSYVPHVLGFQPRESLVFLTMAGKRVGATLRLDLPSPDADPLDYAATVRDYLQSDSSADGVLMVLYTDTRWEEAETPPYAPLVHCLDLVLDTAGLALLDGWLVSSTHWRDYFCPDESCCPFPGHPHTNITESVLNAELVFQGSAYADSLEEAVGAIDARSSEEIHRLTTSYIERWHGKWERTSLGSDSLTLWERVITNPRDTATSAEAPEVAAFLLAGLTCAAVRDCVIVLAAVGVRSARAAAFDGGVLPSEGERIGLPLPCELVIRESDAPEEDPTAGPEPAAEAHGDGAELFRQVFLGTLNCPDWERLDAAHAVFLKLAAVAEGRPRSALLSILGWLEWARGRGSRAHHYLQESLTQTPGYTLAELLLALVGTGSLAPWARRRETAWTSDAWRAA